MKASYTLTLSEYKETVTPLIKEFKKFIRKNKAFFAATKGYCGLDFHTLDTYIQKEIDYGVSAIKREDNPRDFHYDYYGTEKRTEKAKEDWIKRGGSLGKVSKEILEQYNSHLEIFAPIFGTDINRVESDETNSNKRSVRRAIDNDSYVNDMLDGKLTPQEVENIITSAGLKMSKRLKDMKTKVEVEGYNRSSENSILGMKSALTNQVKTVLEPYTDRLKEKKEDEIEGLVNSYLKSEISDLYKYSKSLSSNYRESDEIYLTLSTFIDYKTHNKRETYRTLLEAAKTSYVNGFISKFVARFEEKLAVAKNSLGEPTIDFDSVKFRGSNLEVFASVEFSNGEKLYCETDVIFAGGAGTMQILHQRYLMKFTKDGKKISLESLDSLQA